jgi:soluble lytic murein transglycosylase-like protein
MASRAALIADLKHARREGIYASAQDAAVDHNVPLAFLLAVGSRESRLGRVLPSSCLGPGGEYGVWQINPHGVYARWALQHDPCDHRANAQKAASILAEELQRFGGNARYAAAAYNVGPDDVLRALRWSVDPDRYTTGGNYGTDVAKRVKVLDQLLPVQLPEVVVARSRSDRSVALALSLFGLGVVSWAVAGAQTD